MTGWRSPPPAPAARNPRERTRPGVNPKVSSLSWGFAEEGGAGRAQAEGVGVGDGDGVGMGAKTPGHRATATG